MLFGFGPVLPAYPKPGDTWKGVKGTLDYASFGVTGTSEVIGFERVQTPIGRIRALVVRSKLTQRGFAFGSGTRTSWFSPGRGPREARLPPSGRQRLDGRSRQVDAVALPVRRLAALALALAAASLLAACGGEQPREGVERYILEVNAVQKSAEPAFERANEAYVAFSRRGADEQIARPIGARPASRRRSPPPSARSAGRARGSPGCARRATRPRCTA